MYEEECVNIEEAVSRAKTLDGIVKGLAIACEIIAKGIK